MILLKSQYNLKLAYFTIIKTYYPLLETFLQPTYFVMKIPIKVSNLVSITITFLK